MSPLRRLWNLARRSRLDAELQHDIETHLALIEDEARARGSTTGQARRAARARFGKAHSYRERALDEESLHERLVDHDDWFAPDQWRDDRSRRLARSAFPSPRGSPAAIARNRGKRIGIDLARISLLNACGRHVAAPL